MDDPTGYLGQQKTVCNRKHRRAVEDDGVEIIAQDRHQFGHRPRVNEFHRIGHPVAGGQHVQLVLSPRLQQIVNICGSQQCGRQPCRVLETEPVGNGGLAQVDINKNHSLPGLCQRDRQIHAD